jgi:hypothetical protein
MGIFRMKVLVDAGQSARVRSAVIDAVVQTGYSPSMTAGLTRAD